MKQDRNVMVIETITEGIRIKTVWIEANGDVHNILELNTEEGNNEQRHI